MLGRVRISGDDTLILYIRQYTDEDIKKFLVDDVNKLIRRLKIDCIPSHARPMYFHHAMNTPFEIQNMFYLTSDKNCFAYNSCAIYKLVNRISIFFKILKTKSDYFLNTEKLGNLRNSWLIFQDIYSPPTLYETLNFKLTAEDNSNNDKIEPNKIRNHYASILTLSESEVPLLIEQSHWIVINNLMTSNFTYVGHATPILDDFQVAEILNSLAIQADEYLKYADEEQRN